MPSSSNHNFRFIQAAFGQPVDRIPVWLMRQAGRYLPEYQAVRKTAGDFLDLCFNPELAVEVSLQPWKRFGVDAVIMFSDILTPLIGIGMELDFSPGPRFANPLRSADEINKLRAFEPETAVPYVGKILQRLQQETNRQVPVIGFSGAPLTLAAYMIEGGSGSFQKFKAFLQEQPEQLETLLQKLTQLVSDYLNYQIENGADAIQIFDTWAGFLTPQEYHRFATPFLQQIFSRLKRQQEVPRIYFMKGGATVLTELSGLGADVISCDPGLSLTKARTVLGPNIALQGNLAPEILLQPEEVIRQKAIEILQEMKDTPGFIFNLGHGVQKTTRPEAVQQLVKTVQNFPIKSLSN